MQTRDRYKRWPWYGQTLDAVLALAGLSIIVAMIIRWSFPLQGILLALSCVGLVSGNRIIDSLLGPKE
jgi:hypothetical protein